MLTKKYQKLFRRLAATALGAATLWGSEAHAQLITGPANGGPSGRFDSSVIAGNQPGVQTGSAQVGGFVSLFDSPDKIFFLDGSSNNNLETGNWSADIGLGSRFLHQESGAVLGANVFYNYRNASTGYGDFDFQTVGFGFEALLEDWAFRTHAAFDVGSTQNNGLVQGVVTPSYVDATAGPMGVQNILLSGLQNNFASALNSVDLNVSRKLEMANAEVGAGVYYLSANDGPNSWGVNGTAEAWLTDNIASNVTVSHDDLFGTTVYGGVSVHFGGPRVDADARRESVTSRLWARGQRRRVIPVASYNLPAADRRATNPDTGNLVTVLPVGQTDNLVMAPGVMTDIILVDAGTTFTGLAPIVLNEGQRLLSASVLHMVDTAEIGAIQLPGTDLGGMTTIDMSTGNAVVIANNTEVSGFTITNAGANGIFGDSVTGFDINRNALSGGTFGLRLDGTNSGTVSSNTASGNAAGFLVDTLSGGTVSGNTASGNGDGFDFGTIFGGTVSGNTASMNTSDGFSINDLSGGTVSDNTASGNTSDGFSINDLFGGTFSGNTASGNTRDGFLIISLFGGTFSGNTASGNTRNGFEIRTLFGGTVSGNTASMNTGNGFEIGTLFGGTVSGNTASGNDIGFDFGTLSGGMVSGNTASWNTSDGFEIFNLSGGTFSGNTTSGNGFDGFSINTLSGGTFSGNTASGNTFDGFFINSFSPANTATFMSNEALHNTLRGYDIGSGTPNAGAGTNTGSGNGSNDTF